MNPAPAQTAAWLQPQQLDLAALLLRSYQLAFGEPLLAHQAGDNLRLLAQELFAAATVVLAHDGADPGGDPGPRLIYANRAALVLWKRPWTELVGMPSRLTAEPSQRADRARALQQLQGPGASRGYSCIRLDSQGRRFQIRGTRLWTLRDAAGNACGQAAAFGDWCWL